ncbi:hypothetical protein ACQPX6_13580 [Actinomycetospora sp. CA-101289]|uniref:hypothetical protein n=1 Tax=Actinomycetospora sp. CA-101289 TaxID=3239893 RepID=UPI003D95D1CD
MENMQENARILAEQLQATGRFELIGAGDEQLPLVAFRLAEPDGYDEFDVAWQLSAERGWMVPAYTLPPDAPGPLSRSRSPPGTSDEENACRRTSRTSW